MRKDFRKTGWQCPLVVTYCKYNLQVVQHVNFFGESFAAPAYQVVLTATAVQKVWNLKKTNKQTTTLNSISCMHNISFPFRRSSSIHLRKCFKYPHLRQKESILKISKGYLCLPQSEQVFFLSLLIFLNRKRAVCEAYIHDFWAKICSNDFITHWQSMHFHSLAQFRDSRLRFKTILLFPAAFFFPNIRKEMYWRLKQGWKKDRQMISTGCESKPGKAPNPTKTTTIYHYNRSQNEASRTKNATKSCNK